MKAEQLRQQLKHKKQWEDLKARNEAALVELEQLQVGHSCKLLRKKRSCSGFHKKKKKKFFFTKIHK